MAVTPLIAAMLWTTLSTDNPVSSNGGAIALFDEIAEGDEGQCKERRIPRMARQQQAQRRQRGGGNGMETTVVDGQSGGMTLLT
jgi:hypothetical protein